MAKTLSPLAASSDLEAYRDAGGSPDSAENQRIKSKLVDREVNSCVSMLIYHFSQNPEALNGSGYSYDDLLELCTNRTDNSAAIEALTSRAATPERQAKQFPGRLAVLLEPRCKPIRDNPMLVDFVRLVLLALQFLLALLKALERAPRQFQGRRKFRPLLAAGRLIDGRFQVADLIFGLADFLLQAIQLDHVISAIAAEMGILKGQRHEWTE